MRAGMNLRNDPDRERATWQTLREHPGQGDARDQLILRYLPLVRYVAWRAAASGLGQVVDAEDLISYGTFGLIDAVDRYDLDRGVDFQHFAISRIHGSIIDELRKLDWAPRSVRFHVRLLENTIEAFEFEHGRGPTPMELATRLGWTLEEVYAVRRQSDDSQVVSLSAEEEMRDNHTGSRYSRHALEDLSASDPILNLEIATTRRLLAEAVTRLPTRERAVAAMYWREGLTLGEISERLQASQSWVCELYTKAAMLLKESLPGSIRDVTDVR